MNQGNCSMTARTMKIASGLIEALKAQGVAITPSQENAARNIVSAEKKKGNLDRDAVMTVAEDLGFDVGVSVKGRYSMEMGFKNPYGEQRYIAVDCSGEKYWIEVADGRQKSKWCMPRDEVYRDRSDKFLIDVLRTLEEVNGDLIEAVSICLGISAQASIGHTKDVLSKRRSGKNT